MDHSFAINNHTAERYLLGELNSAERDAYEEHFFSCPDCAEEIKSASDFIETARQVVQKETKAQIYSHAARASVWGSWLNWRSILQPIPAAACALLVTVSGLVGYQRFVTIPQLTEMASAHVVPQDTQVVGLTISRGDTDDAKKLVSTKASKLRFRISQPADWADIVTAAGVTKFSRDISKQRTTDPVELYVAAGALQPGKYSLVIRGVKTEATGSDEKGDVPSFAFEVVK